MTGEDKSKGRQRTKPEEPPASKPEPKEDPAEWGDPICVCEAEPYWQEVADRLEKERR